MEWDYRQGVTEIAPGLVCKPAFSSQEEYERFREEFSKAVRPDIERYNVARAKSLEASIDHWIC
jgi:hypothetical protein